MIIISTALILLELGQFHPWLLDRLNAVPLSFWFICLAFLFPFLISRQAIQSGWLFYLRVYRFLSKRLISSPVVTSALIFFLSLAIFWYFRINRADSGDIWHFEHAAEQGYAFLVEHAPLETLIRCWLSELLRIWPETNLVTVYRILSCIYGGIYVLTIAFLSLRFSPPFSCLLPLFFLITPVLNIFCGYQEVYALPILAQVAFLFSGLFYLRDRIPLTWVSFCFGIAVAVAFWNGVLGISYLYLVWIAWNKKQLTLGECVLQILLVIVPTLVSLALLESYANPFAGIITRIGKPSLLIPLNQTAQVAGYTTFSSVHLADFANEVLLILFVPFALILSGLPCRFRRIMRKFRHSSYTFLVYAGIPVLMLGFLYYSFIGFPLDWDLFTFMFPTISLLGVTTMSDSFYSRVWRKRLLILFLCCAGLSAAWILQNALFWRYPLLLHHLGPAVSVVIPDFYYKQMDKAFSAKNETNLYWLADQALEESPDKYREILEFMDDWMVSTLGNLPARAFDYPGWACDLVVDPNVPDRLFLFDKRGRIFLYEQKRLHWIYSPQKPLEKDIVAGDLTLDGSAVMLMESGKILSVTQDILANGISGNVVWGEAELLTTFLSPPPSNRDLPVAMVDLAVRKSDGEICVLDNFNRVWESFTGKLLLEGIPSYKEAMALDFTYSHQPVTIDVHNRLSYNKDELTFPFETQWFYPIVRDFSFSHDEKGLQTLDLNGNIHYTGSTLIYEDTVSPGEITDRYTRLVSLPHRDTLVLLDNRYRVQETNLDKYGFNTREKISSMLKAGNYSSAYKVLSLLWLKGSQYTSLCYDLVDTEMIRAVRGIQMYKLHEAIPMLIDAFPVSEEMIIFLDRWGRMICENKGVTYLIENSGLTSWPRSEAVDGTLANRHVLFLCKDGTVWTYRYEYFLGEELSPFERAPVLWANLHDIVGGEEWIGIESTDTGEQLVALSASGILLRIDLHDKNLVQRFDLPRNQGKFFDFDYQEDMKGFSVAYTSKSGPARVYKEHDEQIMDVPQSDFGWEVISDIVFSEGDNIILLDKYGVIHQYNQKMQFSEKPYTTIMDAIAFRFYPSSKKAIWLRSNGEIKKLRYH